MSADALLLSIAVATAATILATPLAIGLGWWISQSRSRVAPLIEAAASVPIVLPPTVLGYYLLVALGSGSPVEELWRGLTGGPLVFTTAGAVVAAGVASFPYVLRAARAAVSDVDPDLEDAARASGMTERQVAWVVTLPLARRGILAGISLGFARALGDFGATLMVAGNIPGETRTAPLAIYDAVQAGNASEAGALALALSAIAVAALIGLQRLEHQPGAPRSRARP